MCPGRGKRYCYFTHNDGPGRLAENNGGLAVKHITLIRFLHTGRA